MTDDLELRILLSAQDQASSVIAKLAGGLGPVGTIALGVGAAIAGIGATSVKMAADYQQSLLKVQALAGLSSQQIQGLSSQILKLAPQVGQTPKQLADSLYFLASAGVPADQMLNTMRLSAEAAATGNFDAKLSADALTSAVNASGVGYKNAGNVMDELTATVTAGKMEWSQFAGTVGKLASSMAQNNVTTQEGYAALALFTNSGTTARLAATNLNNAFIQLEQKTDSIAKNAKKLHISFNETMFKTMDLTAQVQYLSTITGNHNDVLLKLMNNNSTAARTVEFLRDHYNAWGDTIKQVSTSMQHGKTTQDAFNVTQEGFNQKMKDARAALDVVFIKIGTDLLPVLEKFLNVYVIPLITRFSDWITQSGFLKAATQDLAVILQWTGQLVQTLADWLGTTIGFMTSANPLAEVLRTTLLGVGVAIGTVKIVEMGQGFLNFATQTIPQVITKLGQLTGVNGLGGIGPAATSAQTEMAVQTGLMETDLVGVETDAGLASTAVDGIGTAALGALGPVGALFFGFYNLAHFLRDNNIIPAAGDNQPAWVTHRNPNTTNPSGTGDTVPGGWGTPPPYTGPADAIPPNKYGLGPVYGGSQQPPRTRGGFASGGPVRQSGWYDFMERGIPEGVAYLPSGAYVTPGGGSGGHTFNIGPVYANTVNDASAIAVAIKQELADMMRSYTPLSNITSGGRL